MFEMLTTTHVDDFILTEENGNETVSIGNLGQRRLREQFLSKPTVDFDLNEGYENWEDEDRSLKRLHILFEYMMKKSPEGDLTKVVNGANFVTRRGVLIAMAMGKNLAPIKGNWQVVCERRKGVIFMEEEMLPEEIVRRANETEQEKLWIFWGHRFTEYMVDGFRSDDASATSNSIANEKSSPELRMVMTATLENDDNPIKMMYSGEVDAVDSDGHYVEIKTMKLREPRYNDWFKKDKSVKWWIQSRLVDVEYLVVGVRDEEGHVRKLEKMSLDKLHGLQDRKCTGRKCLRFLRDTLATIDEALKEGEAMRVNCTRGNVTMVKIGSEEAGILTEKFIHHFKL